MNLDPFIYLTSEGELWWHGKLSEFFHQNEALDNQDTAKILRELTEHGRCVIGGGAAEAFHIVLAPEEEQRR